MKQWLRIVSLVLALALVAPAALAQADKPVIGILQFVQHAALDAAREGFIAGLEAEGFRDGENVIIVYENGQASQDINASIADRFIADGVDLVLAIATPSVLAVAGKTETIPILGTAVTDYVSARLVQSNEAPGFNVSGTTDMNPVADQIALAKRMVPDMKTLGLLYTSSEVNSQTQAAMAKEEAAKLGLEVVERTINSSADVQQAAIDILGQVDVLYLPTDNIVASAIALISEQALAAGVPLAVGEEGMVRGGGTFTLGINYFNLGEQTGRMAARILRGEAKVGEMPIESQTEFNYLVNKTFADAIGLEIPEDLLAFAEEIQ
ncbi:MAG TPA: ABC transporter substrate-binding protein [Candidatus Limnocylindria bacterium]|nr:ABC transporter substrate-binding protein [Candidatus Limnocylindria bacterium]